MKRFKSTVVAVLAVVIAVAYALPAVPAAAQSSSSALSIAPKKNYVVEPGKSVKDTLKINNLDQNADLTLTLRVIDFTFTDNTGSPKLFLAQDAPQTTWSLKPFLTIPKTVTIPKGGSKVLDMSIAVPAGHGAGSYYSAIIYSTGAPGGGNVGLAASGVTLVFTEIPGKVNEDLKLQKLGAYKDAMPDRPAHYVSFATEEPKNIAYTLKNNGNVTEAPAGNITVSGWFGRSYSIDNVNPNESLALIGQSRTFVSCLKLKAQDVSLSGSTSRSTTCDTAGLWPGYYSVKLDLFYGRNGNITQEIVGSSSFWYIPWWFMIVLAVLLVVVAFLVWRAYIVINRKLGRGNYKKATRRK